MAESNHFVFDNTRAARQLHLPLPLDLDSLQNKSFPLSKIKSAFHLYPKTKRIKRANELTWTSRMCACSKLSIESDEYRSALLRVGMVAKLVSRYYINDVSDRLSEAMLVSHDTHVIEKPQ